MNHSYQCLILVIACLALPSPNFAALGCRSYPHSIDHDDHASFPYVACSCPCTRTLDAQGLCLDCQHFGDPNRHLHGANRDLR
ncbi:MAG TPA: hypothetical protein VJJ83_01570 [Candidatus Babeliales bacterium]|nr:hypothetical protein [Candidatus Babeliales bacterium]